MAHRIQHSILTTKINGYNEKSKAEVRDSTAVQAWTASEPQVLRDHRNSPWDFCLPKVYLPRSILMTFLNPIFSTTELCCHANIYIYIHTYISRKKPYDLENFFFYNPEILVSFMLSSFIYTVLQNIYIHICCLRAIASVKYCPYPTN